MKKYTERLLVILIIAPFMFDHVSVSTTTANRKGRENTQGRQDEYDRTYRDSRQI